MQNAAVLRTASVGGVVVSLSVTFTALGAVLRIRDQVRFLVSQSIEREKIGGSSPSFWLREQTPKSWTAIPPPADGADVRRLEDDLVGALSGGFVFGGGMPAEFPTPRSLP